MKKLILLSILISMGVISAQTEVGKASYYSTKCNHGTKTASGQKLNNDANTFAHKTLPIGTRVKITNLKNGKMEEAVCTDRGPWVHRRIVDVTIGLAKKLGFVKDGITTVKIEVIGKVKIK